MLISHLLPRLIMQCCFIVNFYLRISTNLLCYATVAESNVIKLKVPFYTYSSTSACMSDQRYEYILKMNKAQSMLNIPVCCPGTGRTVSCREVRGSGGRRRRMLLELYHTFADFSRSGIFRGLFSIYH
jgi:hypothetical protein